MSYKVKEIFYTLQGEGAQAGRPAVFCRFTGCNLWSGREEDRTSAKCWFCDTDFVGTDGVGGGSFKTAEALAERIVSYWPAQNGRRPAPYVVFTGGEPLLQLDEPLIKAVKERGFTVAVESNGTLRAPAGIDWLTVSPKPNAPLEQLSGSELKLVYPHEVTPESVAGLSFEHFYLSPLWASDPTETARHTALAVEYCLKNPQWRLTIQHHKIWNIR